MRKKRPHCLIKSVANAPHSEDLVRRDFTDPVPGMKHISDITQTECVDEMPYLVAILDCFDGGLVGFSMQTHICASLYCAALGRKHFCSDTPD